MKANADLKYGRPIDVSGMAYAPISELGVVFLFGRLAEIPGEVKPQRTNRRPVFQADPDRPFHLGEIQVA